MRSRRSPLPAPSRRLLQLYEGLAEGDRATLLAFAEFLAAREGPEPAGGAPRVFPEPEPIERPAQESVVAAMRRLSATYAMLDRGEVLHQASALMGAHVLQGRPAPEVIDELEALFRREYQREAEAFAARGEDDPCN